MLPGGRSRSARAEKSSLAFVLRLALLHERGDPFPVILREPGVTLQVALQVELRVERVPRGRVEGFLDEAIASGRAGSERASDGCGFLHQTGIVQRPPDEAP